MRVSLFRNRVWIAFLLIAATYLALDLWRPTDFYLHAAVIVVLAVVLAQLIAWIFSLLLAKRIRSLNNFTERLLDTPLSSDELPAAADDELGILNQSLHKMSTRIRDLVDTLSLESNRRESILASMVEGVLAVDNRLQVIFCNDPLARVLGAKPPVEEGTPVLDLVRDPALVNLLTQVIATGESVKHKIQLSSGEGKSFEAQAAPLAMPERRGAIVILHDITDLERLNASVKISSPMFRTSSARLSPPYVAMRKRCSPARSQIPKTTAALSRSSSRTPSACNNIAADLMVLSELESGRPAAEPEVVSVRDAVEMALSTLESEARVRGVNLVPPEPNDHFVLGHKIRLEQALVNLLDNAVKFNRPNGEARIETGLTTDGKVCIVVSDTGSGIPSDDLPRIFERFYRVDKARSRAVGGTGLGLSIVKHVVERMNGAIKVESHLGRGSAFTILIPALSGLEDADAPGAAYDHHARHPQKHAMLHDADRAV